MKIVLDTNVLVSAMLTGGGAAREVVRLCLRRRVTPVMGAALYNEYEDVLSRQRLFRRSPLTAQQRETLFDALMSVSAWSEVYYLWRPNLRDPDDDHLMELALAANASWIVTSNLRDFAAGELRFDAFRIGRPGDFLAFWEDKHERDDDPAA